MKHKRFEENILVDEAYTNYGQVDKNADQKKSRGIAKNFAETLEYEDNKKWHDQIPDEPPNSTTLTPEQVEHLRKEANSALHGDALDYETKANKNGSSDHQWVKTLLNKGAIGDRVAAATVLIQDNPLYNLTALRNLINNVKPAKKKDGIVTIDALSELLVSDLLIPNVKLRTFEQHPLGHLDEMTSGNRQTRKAILKLWYFEDQLKELYGTYVEALNKFAHDTVDSNKEKAVSAMSYLLMHHPEREKMLLSNIINKLGDPSQAVASKVIYHLCQLLYNHPNMKLVVLNEIEKMLFRPNISPRAQYYGICFLNQFYLGKDDSRTAENLIKIYFSFFKASIKTGNIESRLMSAILTGVKRAYPFADRSRLTESTQHVDAVHKLVHLAGFNVAVHALALLFHISDANKGTSDRYYMALYRKLTNADIFNTTHSALLFSLIYKSLRQDKNIPRVTAFIKRLLQLCCYMTPAQASGMLFLISQVLKDSTKKEAVRLMWTKQEIKQEIEEQQNESKIEENMEHSVTELDNSIDNAETMEKVEDKNEVEITTEKTKMDLLRGDKKDLLLDDDDEERYVDMQIDEEGNVKPTKRKHTSLVTTGWFHAKVKVKEEDTDREKDEEDKDKTAKIQLKKTINMDKVITVYNPYVRNPSFAGANTTAYMELIPLAAHYHPTVKMFAEKLINNQIIQYSGDPLKDFSGIRFLDRFVFKNPKRRTEQQQDEGDVKKVKGSHPKFAVRKNYMAKGIRSVPVNSASYIGEDPTKIPVDEKFLYDFLRKRRDIQRPDDEDDDADSVTSEDFEKYLDSVTGTKALDESDEELDYMADMETTKHKDSAKKNKKDQDLSDSDGEDDLVDDEEEIGDDVENGDSDDGELDISADEDEPAFSGDEDELRLEDSEDEDHIEVPSNKNKGKGKMKLNLKGKEGLSSLFASAEEFSTLLEDTASNKRQGSSQAVSNTDNASMKQLAWEEKRDTWIKGYKSVLGKKGNKNKKFKKNGNTKFNKMAGGKGGKRKSDNQGGAGGKKKKFN